jgi:hypothetical protein
MFALGGAGWIRHRTGFRSVAPAVRIARNGRGKVEWVLTFVPAKVDEQ